MLVSKKEEELSVLQAELLDKIRDLESIQTYRTVVAQLEKNATILKLIKKKKRVQKELVNAQHVKKTGQATLLAKQLEEVEAELFAVPLYQQYLTAIEEAQEVLDIISEYIQRELGVEVTESQE